MTIPSDPATMKPRKFARQARPADTVAVIVEAAARILETAGPIGFTTNAIAERAGVSVGSLYQYFPNKDAITRALIRRELGALEAAVCAIDVSHRGTMALTQLLFIAVKQQLDRPALAQLLEIEEERLGAGIDIEPVRERVATALSAILGVAGHPTERAIVHDVMVMVAALVNAAASRGERDTARLVARLEPVVRARLGTV